jgi:hypothetical protein
MPLVDGFGRVLSLAIERYRGDEGDPAIAQDDVKSIATATGANDLALQVIVLWEAPFLDGGQGGPDDDWTRGVSDGVVRYWSAETADAYLSQRSKELRQHPQSGWPSPEAQNEPSDTGSDVAVSLSTTGAAPSAPIDEQGHDVFISHASEDKEAVARPIAEALASAGWRVWLDEYELVVGDRLTESINAGLASSRFGVVVLSRAFFAKRWPKEELEGLAAKEAATGSKVILPVWHGIDQQYLADVAPTLAGRLGVSTTQGISVVAKELVRALSRERQAPVDAEGSEPIVRSLTPSERTLGAVKTDARRWSETPWVALRESDSARTWLIRFIDMYEGMDAGPGDPVHAVRMKAQEFLDAGATDEHPRIVIKMIAEALPNDPRAVTLEQSWPTGEESPAPALNAEKQRLERQRDDLIEVRRLLDDAAIALNRSDQIHRDIYDDLGNADKTEQLKQAGRRLDEVKQRLAIRLGSEHQLTTAFSTCVELSLEVFGATLQWRLQDRSYATATAKRVTVEFEKASREFIDLAARQTGLDLPGRDSGA